MESFHGEIKENVDNWLKNNAHKVQGRLTKAKLAKMLKKIDSKNGENGEFYRVNTNSVNKRLP